MAQLLSTRAELMPPIDTLIPGAVIDKAADIHFRLLADLATEALMSLRYLDLAASRRPMLRRQP